MSELLSEVDKYIEELILQKDNLLKEVKNIDIQVMSLNKFKDNLIKKNNNIKKERKETINECKYMEEKDIHKINLFLEFLDKCNGDTSNKIVRVKMPKLEYYIYNKKKRLWNSYDDFRQDFNAWLNRQGYWENAIPQKEGHENNPECPIIKMGVHNE